MNHPIATRAAQWLARLYFPVLFSQLSVALAQLPAFPGAEGFGSIATGGRGGDVYYVTNRNASGAGSFAYGVQNAPSTGRTIVFAVSGHIRLPSGSGGGLSIDKSKITIAGQTAPGDGICFYNNTMNITGNDIVLRNIRWRYGKQTAGGDSVDIANSQRIILDHCDVMFSTDENISSFGTPPEFFTFQWSVNAWGLNGHSCGGLWDINHATAHHTLWANNHTRNPKCISPSVFDWANNVTFGWDNGFNMAASTDPIARVNIRGSYFIHGGNTTEAVYGGGLNAANENIFKLHMSDSALDGTANGVLDVNRTNYGMVNSSSYDQVATAWPQTVDGAAGGAVIGTPVSLDSRRTAHKKVLSQVGATRMEIGARPLRDEITQLCVDRTAAMQRGIISDPLELNLSTGTAFADLQSTTAPLDTDLDGMPDDWEEAVGYNKAVANNNVLLTAAQTTASFFPAGSPTGYTQLEEYLHFKAVPHGTVAKNSAISPSYIDIDLRKFTSGFTANPTFTLSNISNGSVSQSGSGNAIVRFTPTLNASGRGGFLFTVTDAAGDSWTQQCCLMILTKTLPRPVTWVGDGTANNWNASTANFASILGSTVFAAGDAVTINDTGSNSPTIKVNDALSPNSLTVTNSTKNFTIQGSGAIAATERFTKSGTGTLTIANTGPNAFSASSLEGGSLILSTANALGTSPITASTGTLAFSVDLANPLIVNGAVALSPSGSRSYNGGWSGSGSLQINNTGTNLLTLLGDMSGFEGSVNFAASTGSARLYGNTGSASAAFDLGTGTINLFSRNGGSAFQLGALSGGSGTTLSGTSSTTTPTTYNVGALGTSSTFAGQITNGGQAATALTKIGNGVLTLTGTCTHTGATTINAGSLALLGTLGNTPVSIAANATLSGSGSCSGAVSTASGGMISPGADNGNAAGTLSVGSLTLNSPTLLFDLSGTPGSGNDRIQVLGAGAVTLSGTQNYLFDRNNTALSPGTYDLITTNGTLTASSVSFASNLPVGSRQTLALSHSPSGTAPGYVRLTVTGTNANLTWTGANGGLWNQQTTAAWSGASPATFYNFDQVTFSDSASSGNVSITQPVAPQSITVNNSAARAYSFTGAPITGSTSLVKSGDGTLTLNLTQITLTNCTLTSGSPTVTVSSTSNLFPGMTVTGTGIPSNTTIASVVNATSLTLSQNASATSTTTTLIIETRHSFSGGTFLNGGSLILSSNAAPTTGTTPAPANPYGLGSGAITFNGGSLTLHGHTGNLSAIFGALPNDLIVPAGQTGAIFDTVRGMNSVPFASLAGSLTGSGRLDLTVNYYRSSITGDWSAFAGILNVKRPVSGASDPRLQFGGSTGLPLATVNLEQVRMEYTGIPPLDGITLPIGSLSGVSSSVISGSQNAAGAVTWQVGGLQDSTTFAGNFTPFSSYPIGLEKIGSGTWTLTGTGTVSAGIRVRQGVLSYGDAANDVLSGTSDISIDSAAAIQLNSGATLMGTSCEIFDGGTLRGRGTLQAPLVSNGTVAVAGGTLNVMGSTSLAGVVEFSSLSDRLVITGDLSLNATLKLPATGLSTGRKTLITYSGTLSVGEVAFSNVPSAYIPILDTSVTGEIAVLLLDATAFQAWQITHFGSTSSVNSQASADPDNDGMINLEEYQAGTNPNNAASVLPLVWQGGGSNSWDLAQTANWLENTTARVFRDKRHVSITDTGSHLPEITLSGTLQPSSLSVTNSTKAFTLSGSGSISGTTGLTKSGTNTLTLTTANSYSGATTVQAGVVNLQNGEALGTTASGTTVATNARLELQGGITVAGEALTIAGQGGTAFFNGALNSKSGSNTWTGPITLTASDSRIGAQAGAQLIISGPISSALGCSGLVIRAEDMSASVTLSGANDYAGDTSLIGGVLKLGASQALPSGTTLKFGLAGVSGKLDLAGFSQEVASLAVVSGTANEITSSSAATLTVNAATDSTFAAPITGSIALTKSGPATLTLTGASNYTGTTTAASGKLLLDLSTLSTPTDLLSPTSPLALSATLELKGKPAAACSQTLGNLTIPAGASATILVTPNSSPSTNLTLGNTWTLGSGASLLIDLSAGNATVTSSPPLTGWLLPGVSVKDSVATGPATVVAGKVVRYVAPPLTINSNDSSREFSTLNTVYSNGMLMWNDAGALTNRSVQRLILDTTLSGGTINLGAATNVLTLSSGEVQFFGNNPLTLTGGQLGAPGSAVTLSTNGSSTLTVASSVSSGAGSLAISGTANVILSANNAFTGGLTLNGAILKQGVSGALGSVNGGVNLLSGNLDLNGIATGLGSLSGINGNIVNTGAATTLTLGNNNATGGLFAGSINGAIAITKTGSGTQTLSGNNGYTGATTISAGTLRCAADQSLGSGDLTINGGTLDLQSYSDSVAALTLNSGNITGTSGLLVATSYSLTSGTLSARIGGDTASLTKSGGTYSNSVTLSGSNNYGGTTSLLTNAGSLILAHNAALGNSSSVNVAGSGAALVLAHGISIGGKNITVRGTGANNNTLGSFSGGLTTATNASAVWTGSVTLGDANARIGAGNGGTLHVSGSILGSGTNQNLSLSSGSTSSLGTTVLSGTNSFTGGISLVRGNLKLGAANTLPATAIIDVGSANIVENTTFDLNGFSQTLAGIKRTSTNATQVSTITNSSSAPATLTLNQSATLSYSGRITGNLTLVKSGSGSLTLTNTAVLDATLSLMLDSGSLNLSTNQTIAALRLNGTWQAAGTYNASNGQGRISGSGTLTVTSSGPSGYATWIDSFGSLTSAQKLTTADPDGDGASNFEEYAFGGNPLLPSVGASRQLRMLDVDQDQQNDFVLTLAMRSGAVFSSSNGALVSAAIDGVIYRIEGSRDLQNFDGTVSEITPNVGLSSPPSGYQWRSFRLTPSAQTQRGFLRATASTP